MKRLAVSAAAVFLLLFVFALKPSAFEVSMPDLSDLADESILTDEEASGESAVSITDKLWSALTGGVKHGLKGALPLLAAAVAVLALSSAVLPIIKDEQGSVSAACSLISLLALTAAVYPSCVAVMKYIAECAACLANVMTAVASACTTLYVLEGAAAAASVNASSMLLMGTVLQVISSGALMPFMQSALALAVAGALPGVSDLSGISKFVKNTLTTVMAFVFTLYGFANYLQTSVATSADSYAYRTMRFSAGVMIPVIGNMLGEASRTVSGSIAVMKATVGSAGVAAVSALLLPPVLTVLLYRLALNMASAVAGILGCEREKRFLSDVSGIFGVLFALVSGIAITEVITLAMFIRMGITI